MTRVPGPRAGARLPTDRNRLFLIDTTVATRVLRVHRVDSAVREDQVGLAGGWRRGLAERDGRPAGNDEGGSSGGAEKLAAGFLHGALILYLDKTAAPVIDVGNGFRIP